MEGENMRPIYEIDQDILACVDLETGDTLKLNPIEVQETYKKIMTERKEALLRHCYQYQIDYVEADINKDYNQVLTSYLIKRTRLH
jgi:hypothetical protein